MVVVAVAAAAVAVVVVDCVYLAPRFADFLFFLFGKCRTTILKFLAFVAN